MHVFVNATYIADLLLSPSTPPRPRMGDSLQSSEVLSKLSAIMAGDPGRTPGPETRQQKARADPRV